MSLRNIGTGSSIVAGVDLGGTTSTSSAAATSGGVITGGGGTAQTFSLNGQTIGTEPDFDIAVDDALTAQLIDDAQNRQIRLSLGLVDTPTRPGLLNLGAGAATGAGYTLTATTATPVDLNEDLVIPAAAGQMILVLLQAQVTVGAGALFLDLLSVNSGNSAGQGAAGAGWPGGQFPASYSGPISAAFWIELAPADIVAGATTLRLMYRVASGTTTLLANDPDSRLDLLAFPLGTVVPIPGANTGQPAPTPPGAGTIIHTDAVSSINQTTATATLSSNNWTPVAGDKVYAIGKLHLTGVNAATMAITIADTFGDTGGTAWTSVGGAKIRAAAPNPANSNGLFLFSRTIGTGPSSGHVTLTRNAGTLQQDFFLDCLEVSGVIEAPSQPDTNSGSNVSTVGNSIVKPGATSIVVASVINATQSATAPAPSLPVEGAWVPVSDVQGDGAGWATAYLVGNSTGVDTWGILADVATSLCHVFVLDPSGSPTAAPGTETWTHADSTTDISADNPWTGMTA